MISGITPDLYRAQILNSMQPFPSATASTLSTPGNFAELLPTPTSPDAATAATPATTATSPSPTQQHTHTHHAHHSGAHKLLDDLTTIATTAAEAYTLSAAPIPSAAAHALRTLA
ncbi:hypothetical protein [Candidatus Korobacter versatilis]|uniref:hypothetical protein n=1 Tax=Candidatus Korobacter versatilis TaxID=658062 RepID=UPI0002E0CC81|nr:hypothetical protein [Candidatus Koribacter versatilis]